MLREHRGRDLGDVALRAVAQLDAVAQDHQAVGRLDGFDQRRAQLGAAQQVRSARRADVEVGDDERPHGG